MKSYNVFGNGPGAIGAPELALAAESPNTIRSYSRRLGVDRLILHDLSDRVRVLLFIGSSS